MSWFSVKWKIGASPLARGCLKSPDSRQILSSTTFCELGIDRAFQTSSNMSRAGWRWSQQSSPERFDRFGRRQNSQVDLALLSFALHFFHHWQRPSASADYKSPAFPGYFLFD